MNRGVSASTVHLRGMPVSVRLDVGSGVGRSPNLRSAACIPVAMMIPHVRGGMKKLKPQDSNEIMQGRRRLERMWTRQGCKIEGRRIGGRFRDRRQGRAVAHAPGLRTSGSARAGRPGMTERDLESKRPTDDIPDLTP